MSENDKKDEHGCLIGKETWQDDKCVPIEKSATQPLTERIMGVVEEVMMAKLDAFEKKIDGKIDVLLKSKEVEIEQALRKGFGLEQDPVVHMSDLIAYGRKAALEKADTGKRTPAPEGAPGPEGNVKPDLLQKMFADARKGVVS